MPQMPDVAGESKAAAEKAAKAAQEAAAEAARKSKEAYDLVIPAEIDWCVKRPLSAAMQAHSTAGAHVAVFAPDELTQQAFALNSLP